MSESLVRHRFTVEDLYAMSASGVLTEDDRVELIEGEVVDMTPIDSRHAGCVNAIVRIVSQVMRGSVLLGVQNPLRLDQHSEPQPDLVLLKPRDDDYRGSHPGPDDVLLLVEVSGSSLKYDREVKLPLYARAGIREVWIVDLAGAAVDVHQEPLGATYQRTARHTLGETLEASTVPGLRISVREVLGR